MRIIFLGTPDFAVASLQALHTQHWNVVAVVTAPDKPAGRGMSLQPSAVKQYAVQQNIPVLQPEKLREEEFLETLRSYRADIQVVVAFRMLPEVVWSMPPMGTINVHASLLPNYRGAAPIHWAIMNGEIETGVTTFKLQHAIDTGNILLQRKVAIQPEDNTGTLYHRLMIEGAALLLETLHGLVQNKVVEKPQDMQPIAHHAPKITKELCKIDWNQTTASLHNKVRGLSPTPGAYTFLPDGRLLKILQSKMEIDSVTCSSGTIETDHRSFVRFATTDGWLYALEVQVEGKKRMPVAEFLKGNTIPT
jgi:methionyl-tRNA formyltransferase